MNLKKLVAKTLVFAMAMTFVPAVNMGTAKAAAPTDLAFSGVEGTLSTATGKFWGVAKELKDNKKANLEVGGKFYLVTDVQPVADDVIDLSSFGSTKDTIIAVGSQAEVKKEEWTVKTIKAGSKSFVVGYFADKTGANIKKVSVANAVGGAYGYLGAVDMGSKTTPAAEVKLKENEEKIEVKQGNGSWKTLKKYFAEDTKDENVTKKLQMLAQRGGTLTFRQLGETDTWPSKEVKVKIVAQAKAPNAKVDPVKSEIGLKKGMEYRIALEAAPAAGDKWQTADKKMTLAELKDKDDAVGKIDGTKDATIEVKTGATSKKIASKVSTYTLKKQDAPTLVALTGDGDLVASKLTLKVKTTYDIKKGAELINKDTAHEYEVYVSQDGTAPAANAKWTKIKAPKDAAKPTKGALKYSASAKPNTYTDNNTNAKIYVRYPGSVDKKTGVITMASAAADATFKLANVAQNVTVTGGSGAGNNEITVATPKATAVDKDIEVTITNVTKAGTPKVKVTATLANVAVKAGKIDASTGKFTVTVKATNKAFTEAGNKELKFTVSYEGATKEIIVKYNVT